MTDLHGDWGSAAGGMTWLPKRRSGAHWGHPWPHLPTGCTRAVVSVAMQIARQQDQPQMLQQPGADPSARLAGPP